MLTDEEKLLGITETSPKKLYGKKLFTDEYKFEVWTDGLDNKSIETGELVGNILSFDMKQEFINGANEIMVNDLHIRLIADAKEPEKVAEKPKKAVKKKAVK